MLIAHSSVPFRQARIQKEMEAAELKKTEAAMRRKEAMQELIKEKEREVLQLQVRCCQALNSLN